VGFFPRPACDADTLRPKLNQKQRIFVVDDEQIIAQTAAMILRWQGFNVESFIDPSEALEASRTQAPDLLITDIGMHRLSGIELAIQVRENCPNCKVLLLSGKGEIDAMLETFTADGQVLDLLLKPIHPNELLSRVRQRLGLDS
jgi:DNA-binding response OmpR family regulator